jgi:hypothetical protein
MMISTTTIAALALLLLPIPLSFMIPASRQASPDPWKLRRARQGLAAFAVFVAGLELAYLWFLRHLWEGSQPTFSTPGPWGWAGMSWFFLAGIVLELRRGKPDPFPGKRQRSASLSPRETDRPIGTRIWWSFSAVWLVVAILILTNVPDPIFSTIFLAGAGAMLAMGPLLIRRASLVPEPFLPEGSDRLAEAYDRRRVMRARTTIALVLVPVVLQTVLAAGLGWNSSLAVTLAPLGVTLVVIVGILIAYLVAERASVRRIRELQGDLAGGGE